MERYTNLISEGQFVTSLKIKKKNELNKARYIWDS